MPYQAVIFDLDGTLLDTLEDIGDAVNRVLSTRGLPVHLIDAYRFFVGDGVAKLITRALPEDKRDAETLRSCLEAYREDYDQHWNIKTRLYEGIGTLLDELTARGLKLAILSNKPHEFTERCVREFLSKWSFDAVIGGRDGVPLKPDPAGALEIARTLGIPPAACLYLGDTAVDIKTAIAAGMTPVGVLWGFRPTEELRESGAKILIEQPLEILRLLECSRRLIKTGRRGRRNRS
jgi:phosphoglycolate phosphatase